MSRPNYDHIETVEDLKNEFFAIQRHNDFLCRETESLQQDNESLRRDHEALSQKNMVLEKQNRNLIQRIADMEVNNLACMEAMRQQQDNLHKDIYLLKKQIEVERSIRSAEQLRAVQFEMGLKDTMGKIYAKLMSKRQEAEEVKEELDIAATENRQEMAMLIRNMGDMVNAKKMEEHKKKTH